MNQMSMKIDYLYLENFIYLESGLKRSSVELDLSNSTYGINVFIGKIGSGKTFILGHLQPFATVGSLDIRNQDDPICEGKDGLKIIKYDIDGIKYDIQHEYIWVERSNSHSTKSYIKKDGEELNPTGNVTSFKYIIQTEFGLEQSYLRLIRLGPNVTGLLELSATERKTYVASMLESANTILALNKKFREELRNYNAKISVLSNKLIQLGMSKENEYEERIIEISIQINEIDEKIRDMESKITKHNAEIALVAPNGYDALMLEINQLIESYDQLRTQRDELSTSLLSLKDKGTATDLAKQIGALETELENLSKVTTRAEDDYRKYRDLINQIDSKIAIIKTDTHIKVLRDTYEKLKAETDEEWMQIVNFECSYNSSFVKNLITEIHDIDIMISDVSQYDNEVIKKVYYSDASIIGWARDRGEMLTGRKINLNKMLNNLTYSASYVPIGTMYTPPLCPSENCPYKRSHPYTLSDGKSKKEINEELEKLRNEIDRVDKEIYLVSEYPTIYSKISSLKAKFNSVATTLKNIGCLVTDNLLLIITRIDLQRWYNYNKIIDTEEKCIIKERYYESLEKLHQMESELRSYDSEGINVLEAKKDEYITLRDQSYQTIEESNEKTKDTKSALNEAYEIYQLLLDKAIKEQELVDLNHRLDILSKELRERAKNADMIAPYAMVNKEYAEKIRLLNVDREGIFLEKNKLTTILNDIRFTKQEMETDLLEQKYLTHIVNATSSKEGIPLELINDFVMGCKDIVNELTYEIFEDDICLEEFKIDDKEFYVPYSIDGRYIQDVTKASQGQRSLFSIAIAFAFSENLQIPYNIPLLDEVDAPLHKNEHAKFLSMILKHMQHRGSRQTFLITHNSALENIPVNFIATTPEDINLDNGSTLIKLYE